MSDTPEAPNNASDNAVDSAPDKAQENASENTPKNAAESVAEQAPPETPATPSTPPPPEPKPVAIPEALRGCVDKIRETIHNDLDDRELVKVLKKHVRQLKEWDQWSEHARNAYAHLIAAEIIHSKAASICIENGIDFEDRGRSEYEHLLRAVQKRTPR